MLRYKSADDLFQLHVYKKGGVRTPWIPPLDLPLSQKGQIILLEEISLKKSTVRNHIYSGNQHKNSKRKLAENEARERDVASYFKKVDKQEHAAGSLVSMEERVYRVRVVEAFLSAGIPLAKVDCLRGLLEKKMG